MTDWATISSMATAGGTLVLAVATFSSIRSSSASARVAERAMLASQRPILIPSREDDPVERIGFGDGLILHVPGHGGVAKFKNERLYMAIGLRNGGNGVGVIHGWRIDLEQLPRNERPDLDDFRMQLRDLFIPAGTTGFWQGAIRDPEDPAYTTLRDRIGRGERVFVDLLYGDHEGGQRTIARFGVPSAKDDDGARADALRYWNIDGSDPRGPIA